jgi:anti-sigma B factor antagonist
MLLKQKGKQGAVILSLNGELTIDTTLTLEKAFKKIISENLRKVIIECRKLEYVDSSGFSCLIKFSKNLKEIQGTVFFISLTPKVRALFAITKLDSAFKIFESEEEALGEFSGY